MMRNTLRRTLPGLVLLGVLALGGPARAQHENHATPAAAPPAADEHQGHQMGGSAAESAAMQWQMYMDVGSQAYRYGLWSEAEKTFTSAVKEARTLGPTDP